MRAGRHTFHSGLILLDKPSGPTSHDMVQLVRRGTGESRVGHAGTLDPLATGLLILCLGAAARLSDYLRGRDKRYTARVRLGQTTDTYDSDGQILAESDHMPTRETVEAALAPFRGLLQQRPPAYSAIKRGGRKAYELARAGETVELEARPVTIHRLELTTWEPPELTLEVACSSGTYIRSLAHDLGQALGCGAHLTALRRTASGYFELGQAVSLAALQAAFATGPAAWQRHLLPADAALRDWPRVDLSAADVQRALHGQPVSLTELGADWARGYDPGGRLVALLRADRDSGWWRPDKVLVAPDLDPLPGHPASH